MTDRSAIIAKYDYLETEAGGYAAPSGDAKTICRRVAEDLRIPLEDVEAVMVEVWCGGLG